MVDARLASRVIHAIELRERGGGESVLYSPIQLLPCFRKLEKHLHFLSTVLLLYYSNCPTPNITNSQSSLVTMATTPFIRNELILGERLWRDTCSRRTKELLFEIKDRMNHVIQEYDISEEAYSRLERNNGRVELQERQSQIRNCIVEYKEACMERNGVLKDLNFFFCSYCDPLVPREESDGEDGYSRVYHPEFGNDFESAYVTARSALERLKFLNSQIVSLATNILDKKMEGRRTATTTGSDWTTPEDLTTPKTCCRASLDAAQIEYERLLAEIEEKTALNSRLKKYVGNQEEAVEVCQGIARRLAQDNSHMLSSLTSSLRDVKVLVTELERCAGMIDEMKNKGKILPTECVVSFDKEIATRNTRSFRELKRYESHVREIEIDFSRLEHLGKLLDTMKLQLHKANQRRELTEEQFRGRIAKLRSDHLSDDLKYHPRKSDEISEAGKKGKKRKKKKSVKGKGGKGSIFSSTTTIGDFESVFSGAGSEADSVISETVEMLRTSPAGSRITRPVTASKTSSPTVLVSHSKYNQSSHSSVTNSHFSVTNSHSSLVTMATTPFIRNELILGERLWRDTCSRRTKELLFEIKDRMNHVIQEYDISEEAYSRLERNNGRVELQERQSQIRNCIVEYKEACMERNGVLKDLNFFFCSYCDPLVPREESDGEDGYSRVYHPEFGNDFESAYVTARSALERLKFLNSQIVSLATNILDKKMEGRRTATTTGSDWTTPEDLTTPKTCCRASLDAAQVEYERLLAEIEEKTALNSRLKKYVGNQEEAVEVCQGIARRLAQDNSHMLSSLTSSLRDVKVLVTELERCTGMIDEMKNKGKILSTECVVSFDKEIATRNTRSFRELKRYESHVREIEIDFSRLEHLGKLLDTMKLQLHKANQRRELTEEQFRGRIAKLRSDHLSDDLKYHPRKSDEISEAGKKGKKRKKKKSVKGKGGKGSIFSSTTTIGDFESVFSGAGSEADSVISETVEMLRTSPAGSRITRPVTASKTSSVGSDSVFGPPVFERSISRQKEGELGSAELEIVTVLQSHSSPAISDRNDPMSTRRISDTCLAP
eukprot:sb/3461479/